MIETGDIKDRKKSRCPRKFTKSNYKYQKMISLRNRTKSNQELSSDLAQTSRTQVHSSTIRRALVKEGFHSRVARRKSYLRQGNRKTAWICQKR